MLGGFLADCGAGADEPGGGTDIPITFANPLVLPSPARLPRAAETSFDNSVDEAGGTSSIALVRISDPKEHGALSSLPLGQIAGFKVTWADPHYFHTEAWMKRALQELLSDPHEINYTFHVWQYDDPNPSLVVTVAYASGKQGAWWIWLFRNTNVAWAFEDEKGRWWWGLWDGYVAGGKRVPLPASLMKEPEGPESK